jgi:hypothetical protein
MPERKRRAVSVAAARLITGLGMMSECDRTECTQHERVMGAHVLDTMRAKQPGDDLTHMFVVLALVSSYKTTTRNTATIPLWCGAIIISGGLGYIWRGSTRTHRTCGEGACRSRTGPH